MRIECENIYQIHTPVSMDRGVCRSILVNVSHYIFNTFYFVIRYHKKQNYKRINLLFNASLRENALVVTNLCDPLVPQF